MDMMDVRYPHVRVKLVGKDGNAFAIMGEVIKALKKAGASSKEVAQFQQEAMSSDYNNLLLTCLKWVDVR